MSGQQPLPPFGNGPRGWNPRAPNASASPSSFLYRPPSPWTTAPSPPPIISGPRPYGQAMSPAPQLRGQRPSNNNNNMPHPRPQWPGGNQSPAPYQPRPMFEQPSYSYGPPAAGAPRAYRPAPLQHQSSYGAAPTSSFQLSPTPSPIVCQTPSSDFTYSSRQTPLSHQYPQPAPPPQYLRQPGAGPPLPPQPRQHAQDQIDFVGVPLEPPQPRSYVIYDDEEEFGPSTAEIIANQSQDYIDEKLAEYQMTILQLQGE
ncbi:leucine-rich repeat extensin-like protein 5 [Drosophila busckii]|uniref:leucine-rich repeat extensin-like protein 5 n=1 Tax=Drosophila busckii TaxID=30019 RepID=UPI001432F967|nr:leucine-rich repeat extensin-like protein 5 [Drosophila busckii]